MRPFDARITRPAACLCFLLLVAVDSDVGAQAAEEQTLEEPPAEGAPAEEAQTGEAQTEEPEILGAAAAFSGIDQERQRIWLPAGSPLFERPDQGSHRLTTIDVLCEIEVLERSGDWYLVHFSGRNGWVRPDLPEHLRSVGTFPAIEPVEITTPGFAMVDPGRRRELALEVLGLTAPNGRLGPWQLLTDVTDRRILERLDRIATGLAASYRERYGVEPADAADQAIALFSTEATYRPFESEVTHLAGVGAHGHAGDRLAALYVEGQQADEAASLLVHELTHLMNRAALGPTPPPWLEEGIANDLAYSRIGGDGILRLGSINGSRTRMGSRLSGVSITYSGGIAALAELLRLRSQRRATPLEELVALEQSEFLDSRLLRQHYVESAFLVRFLVDGEKRRYAEGFRAFLEALSATGGEDAALPDFLATDWARLERGLHAWLNTQSAQLMR